MLFHFFFWSNNFFSTTIQKVTRHSRLLEIRKYVFTSTWWFHQSSTMTQTRTKYNWELEMSTWVVTGKIAHMWCKLPGDCVLQCTGNPYILQPHCMTSIFFIGTSTCFKFCIFLILGEQLFLWCAGKHCAYKLIINKFHVL